MSSEPIQILQTRKVYFKKENDFIYKNVSLIRKLKINRTKECSKIHLLINGVVIPPSDHTLTTLIWDMAEVRTRLSDEYMINDFIRLDATLGIKSYEAMKYYTHIPINEFNQTIFTNELQLVVRPMEDNVGSRRLLHIEGEEEIFTSDAMLEK
jgi:hypothetical protein